MAATPMIYRTAAAITPAANPTTLVQFLMPSNLRGIIKAIEMMFFGTSGSQPAVPFDLVTQSTAGAGLANTTTQILFEPALPSHTKQMTALGWQAGQTEPTLGVSYYAFALHPQGQRLWIPPNAGNRIVMDPGTRWALRYLSATFVQFDFAVYLEE